MDTPKIYVADLEAYNSGRLVGKWFELDDYSSAEELMEAITEYMTSLGKEEYAIHDIENLPRSLYDEYMGEKDFEKIYEILDKAKEMDLPFEVVAEVAREYSLDAVNGYQGKFDDMSDFAYRMVEDLGMESFTNPSFLYVSETDKRIIAGEEGDNYVNDIVDEDDGERIIEEADMDLDEYREADEDTRSEMVRKAKEVVSESIYDEWYNGLDDPYYFLVEEKGIYSPEDLKNVSFVQLDYDKIGQELEYDYNTVEYDGDVYVFSQNYGKGGFLSSIFGGGKKKYNRSWHQDHYQVNKKEDWERQDNIRHGKKARNRFMDGGFMSVFADGGNIDNLGNRLSDYDLNKLQGDGMTIKELREFFKSRFPDSFGFSLNTFKNIEDIRALKPNPNDPFKGIENDTLKLSFDRFHSMDYRVFQGGENTYFYFLLTGSDNNAYLGQFGFKDQGEVPKEYVTSFVSLIHKLYGFPFSVSHEIYAKGGKTYNRSWHQDHYQVNKKEDWERQDNMRHGKTARNRFMDGGQMSMFMDGGMMAKGGSIGYEGQSIYLNSVPSPKEDRFLETEIVIEKIEGNKIVKSFVRKTGEKVPFIIDSKFKVEQYADGGMMAKGGMTKNTEIIRSFLTSKGEYEVNNLSTHYNQYDDMMLLRNYYTLIATRKGNMVKITAKRFSKSTSTIVNALVSMANDMGFEVSRVEEFAKGGRTKNYKYIPNKEIESITITQGEGSITIPNDNILDGAYIRRRYKAFGRGGNTGNYNYGRSYFQDRARFAKGQEYEVQYRKHK